MRRRYLVLLVIFLIFLAVALFMFFYSDAKDRAIKQLNETQTLHARQAVQSIESFFKNWTNILVSFSRMDDIRLLNADGRRYMELFYGTHREELRAISRISAQGKILYTVPFVPEVIGSDISGQPHIQEIKNSLKPVVSEVFQAVQGYDAIAINVPVFKGKAYDGTIAVTINFRNIAKRYLQTIKIGESGYAWMISRGGTELYCPVPGHTGRSVFENCREFPTILEMANRMMRGETGITTYVYDMIGEQRKESVKKLAVFMPVKIGNTFWSVVVATSEEEVLSSLSGLKNRLILVVALMFLGGGLLTYVGFQAWFIVREEKTRRKNEDELRESRRRLADIIDFLPDATLVIDREGKVVAWNRAIEEMTGVKAQDVLGKGDYEYGLPFYGERRPILIDLVFLPHDEIKNKYVNLEWKGSTLVGIADIKELKGRAGVILHGTASILKDSAGNVVGAIESIRDITDRVRAEEAVKESQRRLADIIDFLPDATLVVNREGSVVAWNRAIEMMTGVPADEMLGKGDYEYAIPFYGDRRPILIDLALHPDQAVEKEYTSIQRMGDTLFGEAFTPSLSPGDTHLSATASVLRNAKGEIIAAIECIRDDTEQKQLKDNLVASEKKYRDLVDNALVGVYQTGLDGNIYFANQEFAKMFGYESPEELMKHSVVSLYKDNQARELFIEELMQRKTIKSYELELFTREGKTRHVLLSGVLENDRLSGTLMDITEWRKAEMERRRLEERLNNAEKMEALGTLAGGVAHDLNNVLGILVGYSELLLEEIEPSSPIRAHVKKIMEGGERAAAIVTDMLTIARRGIHAGKVINLNDVIVSYRKSPEFARLSSFHPDVHIESSLDPDLLNIMGSPIHMTKTLMNLMSNAAEAMPKGGTITIETKNRYLDRPVSGYDDVKDGDYVVLSVSDTGEGIKPEDLKRIFEPFYTKKVMGRSGTGLGLSVVWGTVKDHNGYIDVRSEEGKGTAFSLYFPITREDVSAEDVPVSQKEYMGKGESIIVVDDVGGQRDLAVHMLSRLNYRVIAFPSGEKAVDYLKNNRADLVVLDMIMDPGMDGLDTYREILKIHPRQKAIIVSGFSETERVLEAEVLGAGAYVKKPYVQERLGLAVRKELDKS